MKPRQFYRSPFWRPDIGGDPVPAPRRPEDRHPGPERQPASASRPVLEQTVGYAQSDLALFGKLMDYERPSRSAETPNSVRRPEGRSEPRPAPDVPAAITPAPRAASPAVKDHSNGDLALFRALQAPFAAVRQARMADAGAMPGHESALPSHGYAQADLDAFEKLASFGRPA